MAGDEIGILCHGDGGGEFTVVDFTNFGHDGELCLLHQHGSPEKDIETLTQWRVKKVNFPQDNGPSVHHWITDAVVPIDGRFLCWVDNYQGILVLDVVLAIADEEGPVQLRYIPLPEKALQSGRRVDPDGDCPDAARCVGATAGGMVKLICVDEATSSSNRVMSSADFTV
ncbi:hypothetical protein HU200_034757 [Digitaria exilis]|uniref:DUF1618 domain-containing protein n=1 Tax=Digitaria exilis TaxID=1010633 RepID=A0A835BJF8_9POAL|nr:hypothetical protein HU200_034757 [Digitaria exilis]